MTILTQVYIIWSSNTGATTASFATAVVIELILPRRIDLWRTPIVCISDEFLHCNPTLLNLVGNFGIVDAVAGLINLDTAREVPTSTLSRLPPAPVAMKTAATSLCRSLICATRSTPPDVGISDSLSAITLYRPKPDRWFLDNPTVINGGSTSRHWKGCPYAYSYCIERATSWLP